jgi:hypothetical protein
LLAFRVIGLFSLCGSLFLLVGFYVVSRIGCNSFSL